MPSKSLFGNRIAPSCSHCIYTMRAIPKKDQVLCEKHGVVAADYRCGKYRYDPLRRIPPRPRPLQQFSAEDFSIEINLEEDVSNHESEQDV